MARTRLIVVESFQEDIDATLRTLAAAGRFEVVATATEAVSLAALAQQHLADLVLLDLSLLRRGSKRLPIGRLVAAGLRLVLLSDPVDAATPTAKEEAGRALIEGALEVLFRPPTGQRPADEAERRAFWASLEALAHTSRPSGAELWAPQEPRQAVQVLGVLASTGGPSALSELLREPFEVPVLVALHMPAGFTRGFVRTLQKVTGREVRLAENGQGAEAGVVYLPPDGLDLGLTRSMKLRVGVRGKKKLHPSGNVLFADLSLFGPRAVGVVLTGMGDDGLEGARALKAAGGRLLVQDQASCVVFGMPGVVLAEGLAEAALPVPELAKQLRRWLR